MASELKSWAVIERQHIKDDIMWLKGGATLISPSGDNITKMKIEQLEKRLEHVDQILNENTKSD